MIKKYIELSDKTKIYTNYSLGKDAPTVIIVHGGPGNGFWDQIPFMEKLSEKLNVIAFDERGVNKSDPVPDGFTSEMLIDDIEEIRTHFSVDKAIFIGHSYGGHLLLRFAKKYPEHIQKAVFLCPSFDFLDSFRTVIQRSVDMLKDRNFEEIDVLRNAIKATSFSGVFAGLVAIPEDVQNIVYGYDRIPNDVAEIIQGLAPSSDEMYKSSEHQQMVFSEEEITKDQSDILKELEVETCLIVGDMDPVCSDGQIEKYNAKARNGRTFIIKNSGHFPYLDSIDELVSII